MGQPLSRVIVGFSHRQLGLGGCIGNVFGKMEFKCLFAAVIYGFQLEQYWKRGVVVKARTTSRPWGGIPVSAREVVWVWTFRLLLKYY